MATEKTNESVPVEQVSDAEDMKQSLPQEAQPVMESENQTTVGEEAQPEQHVESVQTDTAVSAAVAEEPVQTTNPSEETVEEKTAATETVDFSDEEVRLAAEAPEFDLGDEESEGEMEQEEKAVSDETPYDYTGKSKNELLDLFATMLAERPVQTLRREVEAIKVAFYKLHRNEVEQLRKAYIEGGGNPEDFAAPVDNAELRLKDLFAQYRKMRDEYIANLERTKEENLQIKLKIIEDLKELINSGETLNHTFTVFRELQQRWKETGPVPQANVKDLWETYNLYVENFYNFIKINKELRDLDLKRNYEAKLALCEEAERLILEPSVINAFHKLQKLHEEWRETGPVANEYKEALWERFKSASSRINKQHQEYFEGLKEQQQRNFELKTELCVKTEELAAGMLVTRKDWNKASDKLLEIQKVWKTIGFAPKKENAKVYERFRNACDKFFEQKRNFYLQVKTEMEHNLQLKNEICEIAESLKDSEEWKKTTDELIALQKRWKEIGPVARRYSDAVWKRFRSACDYFFDRKAQHFSAVDAEHEENLRLKRELLAEIEQCDILAGGFDMIKNYQRRWSEIGFVPIQQKDAIQSQYKAVMDRLFATLRGSDHDRQMDRFRDRIQNMKNSGDRRLRFERDRLYNKVKQLEADIALLENNIGFFSKSKNAEAMIRDVKDKIERAKEEMAAAIDKINLIDKQE